MEQNRSYKKTTYAIAKASPSKAAVRGGTLRYGLERLRSQAIRGGSEF